MLLYAQAAAGPEYEYPAWLGLDSVIRPSEDRMGAYGAMTALHPVIGGA